MAMVAQFEREYVTSLVRRSEGNMSEAARAAGLDRTTSYRIMERNGMRRKQPPAMDGSDLGDDTAPNVVVDHAATETLFLASH